MNVYPSESFAPRMNALLVRAQANEKGLMVEHAQIEADYIKAKESGWVDWEGETALHLRLLKYWINRAERN